MEQSQHPEDALAPSQFTPSQKFHSSVDFVSNEQTINYFSADIPSANHSPPILYEQNLFITNLNLRI